MTAPKISVIVPVWNGEAVLARCLAALAAQTLPRQAYEVIVVDNGSTDATPGIARGFAGVQLLSEPAPGSYAARNMAIGVAAAPLIAFTDADCVPDPDWLERALAAAERHPDFGVLAGRIDLFDEGQADAPAYGDYERLFSFPQAHAARGNCATANWISRTALLRTLGGFDASLKSGGDRQMALRIRTAGHPLIHVPEMIVRHPVRATREALVRKRRRLSGGRWDRTRAAPRLGRVLLVTAVDTARRLRRAAIAPGLTIGRRIEVMKLTLELAGVATGEFFRLARGQGALRE
ncbi:glycosyltransferase family 2 protein [Sphingomonas sp. BT-65]|uniref:glycosyltransferase n=1 Tax=Sphingomonas sp. BT-65 TaxID=2989821 RepID=UPI002236BEA9|nr:glycosyltransferase family A protein [Sphingomonas sp. BT-65]MCW4461912.1 glycosyltransferase family 2 protein [Sphingomonas sp. BT-65]